MKVKRDRSIRYAFGDIAIDAAQLMVYKGGDELDLPPKAVETLIALVERRGKIVSKDELMSAIWTDSVVEESNLSRYIYLLRSQLDAKPGGGEYIETFRRRGYRFSSEVEVHETDRYGSDGRDLAVSLVRPVPRAIAESPGAVNENVVRLEGWTRDQEVPVDNDRIDTAELKTVRPQLKLLPRRRNLPWFVIPLLLFLALTVAVAAYLLLRTPVAVLTDQDTIIIADFENRTTDPVFDGTLRQGLVMQLRQSPFLSILPDEQVRETLKLMKLPADTHVDRSVAREISLRRGLKVFVAGSVIKLGEDYVVGLEAVNAQSEQPVAVEQVQGRGKESVLESLSTAARGIRLKLGEELSSIEKLDVPLQVTTRSLEALRMHTLAWKELKKGKQNGAITYFLKAIELDPEFASAYGDLSVAYYNSGQKIEAIEAIKEAYKRIESVSEIERLNISDLYHMMVTLQLDERERILEMYRDLYPRDFRPGLRLATVHLLLGHHDQAIAEARESVRLGSRRSYSEWGQSLIALGKYSEAREVLEEAVNTGFVWEGFHVQLAEIGVLSADPALVDRQTAILDDPQFRPAGNVIRARINLQLGRVEEGLALFGKAISVADEDGRAQRSKALRAEAAWNASLLGRCVAAQELLGDNSDFLLVDDAQALLAAMLARCGHSVEAEAKLGELLALYPKGTFPNRVTAKIVRALIALNNEDPQKAVSLLNEVPHGMEDKFGLIVPYLKASALLRIGRPADATVEFRRIIDNSALSPLSALHSLAVLGFARSMVRSGKMPEAKAAYERFLEIWKEADSDLPEFLAARREYAALWTS